MQKHVNLVDLVKSFPTNIYLQNLASIQKRTSPVKFAYLAEKSGKGSISNLSTKVLAAWLRAVRKLKANEHMQQVLHKSNLLGDEASTRLFFLGWVKVAGELAREKAKQKMMETKRGTTNKLCFKQLWEYNNEHNRRSGVVMMLMMTLMVMILMMMMLMMMLMVTLMLTCC